MERKKVPDTFFASDRKVLGVRFGGYDDPADAQPERWRKYFDPYNSGAPIEHFEIDGTSRAAELVPFPEIPTLMRLSISGAQIDGDSDTVLANRRKEIVVD